jgi:hypothetical protein
VTDKNSQVIWEATTANNKGQLTKTKQGGREITYVYDATKGFQTSMVAAGIVSMEYKYYSNGNLEQRTDKINGQNIQNERFTYDQLDRLSSWSVYQNNVLAKINSISYYQESGSIQSKSDLGFTMNYGEMNSPPHAITSISGSPSMVNDATQDITYTNFKKIATITEGDYSHTLTYGVDQQRVKGVFSTNNTTTLTRYYLGHYEEEHTPDGTNGVKIRKLHYIYGGIPKSRDRVLWPPSWLR